MLVDAAPEVSANLAQIEAGAGSAEADGYDGYGVPESRHDVFTALTLAARATRRTTLHSTIAVAFARNPMSLAICANDIQLASAGRLRLGLGSQVQQHIEWRYSMPWSQPSARMEELVTAIRAIWSTWATGRRLTFRGQFYRHTLMTDFFNPGPNPYGNPPIWLAAVGRRMAAVAGRVADGVLCHPLTSPEYLHERIRPAVARSDSFDYVVSAMVVLGEDEQERAVADRAVRRQIAFYGSTSAYRPVLELHGWGPLHERLNLLARRQAWDEATDAIDDDVLSAFAVTGTPAAIAADLRSRFGDIATRLSLYVPYPASPDLARSVAASLRT